MKTHSDEEIVEKIRELWPQCDGGYSSNGISITRGSDYIDVEITKMYDWDAEEIPKLTFDKLDAIAQFFDTMNVETASEVSSGGCDTCDYGSSYGFVLRVSDGDSYIKVAE